MRSVENRESDRRRNRHFQKFASNPSINHTFPEIVKYISLGTMSLCRYIRDSAVKIPGKHPQGLEEIVFVLLQEASTEAKRFLNGDLCIALAKKSLI
jgi:hypothetical protein